MVATRPATRGQDQQQRVDRVEHRLLVLLQVAVVGERQALERGQQRHEVADEAAGLAAGQLGDVRVLLLRHDRRAGGVGVVHLDPAELLRGPEHDLLAQPRQVHADHAPRRTGTRRRSHGRRPRPSSWRAAASKPSSGGHGLRVERQRRAGQRAGAERARRPRACPSRRSRSMSRAKACTCASSWWPKEHRLRVLQVGHAGRGASRRAARPGPISAVSSSTSRDDDRADVVAQVEPQVGGDLVVAAAAGAQLAAERAEPLQQAALQRGVHVLVGDGRPELARLAGALQVVERAEHALELVVVEQPRPVQHAGVRPRRRQVVRHEPPVEVHAHRQPGQRVGRAALEAAAPQPHRRCRSLTGRLLKLPRDRPPRR